MTTTQRETSGTELKALEDWVKKQKARHCDDGGIMSAAAAASTASTDATAATAATATAAVVTKLDFITLSRLMPDSCQKLRDGTLIRTEFVKDLIERVDNALHTQSLTHVVYLLAHDLAKKAIPYDQDIRLLPFGLELVKEMLDGHDPADEVIVSACDRSNTAEFIVLQKVKTAFDRTCQAWDHKLGGRKFRRRCELFNAPVSAFQTIIQEQSSTPVNYIERFKAIYLIHYRLLVTIDGVVHGLDLVKKECWMCESRLDSPKICAKCEIAGYCGRDCQANHWKSSHKKMCPSIKTNLAAYEVSRRIIDEAHETGELVEGRTLSDTMDYHVASLIHSNDFTNPDTPRMRTYYMNLKRVQLGEFWFFPRAPNISAYRQEMESLGRSTQDEDSYLRGLCFLLSLDPSDNELEVYLNSAVNPFGIEMPADRFLELYSGYKKETDLAGRKQLRRQANATVLKYLRG